MNNPSMWRRPHTCLKMKTVLMATEQFNNADLNFESNFLVRLNFGWVDHKLIYLGFVSAQGSLSLLPPQPLKPFLCHLPQILPCSFMPVCWLQILYTDDRMTDAVGILHLGSDVDQVCPHTGVYIKSHWIKALSP